MRTASKILLVLFFISTLTDSVFAASPFDIFSKYLPDIAVTDIYQETKFLYATVCNIGGTLTETENTLAIGIWIPGGWIISINAPIAEGANNCQNYQIASIEELKVTISGTYNITAAAILKKGRTEKTISNNKITRSLYISYPSKAFAIPAPIPTYYNSNSINCTASNNYCNNNYNSSNIYNTYCNASNNYCNNTNIYNSNNIYCNFSNGYCSNNNFNGSANIRRSNICPPDDIACNDYFYNNSSNFYQNSSNYCNSSNNYCNTYNSNYNSNYNSSQNIYNTYCNASNNYCNNTNIYNSSNYCNSSNNYCNSYNSNYYNIQYDLPDLVVQRVYQNSSDKHIVAEICNQGGNMSNPISMRTSFVSNNITTGMYNTVQLTWGQCTSTSIYSTPQELGVNYYSGNYYSISVTVDANNSISESNESNNVTNQYLQLWTNY